MTATLPIPDTAEFQPGVYDLTDGKYHGDPVPGGSLSFSGAKKLLPPSCPALFKYELDHPPKTRPEFDFGHAAHQMVLGSGPEIVVVDADSWRTDLAKGQRDEAHSRGAVPLLAADYQRVQAMAAAIREHPIAGALFNPDRGRPEQSLFWPDERTGVWRRARLDWLPNPGQGRMIVPDYKTTKSAAPDDLQRAIHNYHYHQQSAWYIDAVRALNLAGEDAAFVFVFQMKDPPFLVTTVQLDHVALQIGRFLNRQAIDIYAECKRTGRWPGFSDEVEVLPLPPWVERQFQHEDIW